MEITRETVLAVARLARIEIPEELVPVIASEFERILGWVAELERVDTPGVEPTTHAVPLACPLREDDTGEHLRREEALQGAPDEEEGCFAVPAAIPGSSKAPAGGVP